MNQQQEIPKGSLIQSREHGWQGIVMKVTDEDGRRWVHASDFTFANFSTPVSDVFIITPNAIRFPESPCAFVGHITHVERQGSDVVLTTLTNLSSGTTCHAYKDAWVIEQATIVPQVGDAICGTQDYVIISGNDVDYPYALSDNVLRQDWNLPLMPPITGLQTDIYPIKQVFGITVPEDLDANGLESGVHYEADMGFREDRIQAARLIIRVHFLKIQEIQQATGSYGLKHDVEQRLGYHLSNGELIVAMIGEGYTFKRDGINCYFNVSMRSVKTLRKHLRRLKLAEPVDLNG